MCAAEYVVFVFVFALQLTRSCCMLCVCTNATRLASLLGAFEKKSFPVQPRLILAASFVFYNAASLVNLNVNTVRT